MSPGALNTQDYSYIYRSRTHHSVPYVHPRANTRTLQDPLIVDIVERNQPFSHSATMDNVRLSNLQYSWQGPAMHDNGQSHQMLHPLPPQHPYHPPFASQVAQYYHANHQSSYMMYPSSPHHKHTYAPSWDTMSPLPHHSTHIRLGYLPFPSPSSPPSRPPPPINFIHYAGHLRQRPSPFTSGKHTANIHHATSKKPLQSPTSG